MTDSILVKIDRYQERWAPNWANEVTFLVVFILKLQCFDSWIFLLYVQSYLFWVRWFTNDTHSFWGLQLANASFSWVNLTNLKALIRDYVTVKSIFFGYKLTFEQANFSTDANPFLLTPNGELTSRCGNGTELNLSVSKSAYCFAYTLFDFNLFSFLFFFVSEYTINSVYINSIQFHSIQAGFHAATATLKWYQEHFEMKEKHT